MRVTERERTCIECHGNIAQGETYYNEQGECGNVPAEFSTCMNCLSIRNSFFMGTGWIYGRMWKDLEAYIEKCNAEIGEIHIACLSPPARNRVCETLECLWMIEEDQTEFYQEHFQNMY